MPSKATNPSKFWDSYAATFSDLIGPLLVAVTLELALLLVISRIVLGRGSREHSLLMIAFGLLGGVSGMIAGASSEPIVGAVLTGLLGLISAILSYMLGKDALGSVRAIMPFIVVGLTLSALAGLTIGRAYKVRWDDYDIASKKHMLDYEHTYLPLVEKIKFLELCTKTFADPGDVIACEKSVMAK